MTDHKDLKKLVRAHAAKTGKSYTSALRDFRSRQIGGDPAQTVNDELPPDQQRILDFVSDFEFRTGHATPLTEVLLLDVPAQQAALRDVIASLAEQALIALGGISGSELHLTSAGLLLAGNAASWNAVGSRLVAYLVQRLESERSAFTLFTWDGLMQAGVVEGDVEFGACVRLMDHFALSGSGS